MDDEDLYKLVAKNIKKYRQIKGLTTKELAYLSNYSHEYIRRIESEHGKKEFSLSTIYHLARTLDIDIKQLFDRSDEV